jgi:hypothetical protein
MFFAFVVRNKDKDEQAAEFLDEDHPELNDDDDDYLHSLEVCLEMIE